MERKEKTGRMEGRENREKRRGAVVSLCVSVLTEWDESVERKTMKMQSHCTPFIHKSYSAPLTFSNSFFKSLFCWLRTSFTFQLNVSQFGFFFVTFWLASGLSRCQTVAERHIFLFLNNHGDAILGIQDAGVMSREWNVGFLSTSYVFWSNSVVEIVCQDKLVLFLWLLYFHTCIFF